MPWKRPSRTRNTYARISIFAFVAACAALWLFAALLRGYGTSAATDSPSSSASTKVRLHLGGPLAESDGGIIVALKSGIFERAGLVVEIVIENSDGQAVAALAADKDDVALVSARALILARGRGLPVVAFSAASMESRVAFFSRSDLPVRTPRDFAGRAVGYRAGSDAQSVYEALMARNRISRANIKETTSNVSTDALATGAIDVLVGDIGRESYELRKAGVSFDQLRPSQFGVHLLGTVFATADGNLSNRQGLLRKFLQAVVAGWERTYSNMDESLVLIGEAVPAMNDIKLLRQVMDTQRELIRPLGARFGEYDRQRWSDLHALLLQQRQLSQPIDLSRAYSLDVLRELYRSTLSPYILKTP